MLCQEGMQMSVQFVYYKECSFIQHLFYYANQFENFLKK